MSFSNINPRVPLNNSNKRQPKPTVCVFVSVSTTILPHPPLHLQSLFGVLIILTQVLCSASIIIIINRVSIPYQTTKESYRTLHIPVNNNRNTLHTMSKYKDGGAAVTLAQQPRLRKSAPRVPAVDQEDAFQMPQLRNKRKAPDSPTKMMDKAVVKRSALGNVTNAAPTTTQTTGAVAKKTVLQQIDNLKIDTKLPKVSGMCVLIEAVVGDCCCCFRNNKRMRGTFSSMYTSGSIKMEVLL